jgi:hypothetical protein
MATPIQLPLAFTFARLADFAITLPNEFPGSHASMLALRKKLEVHAMGKIDAIANGNKTSFAVCITDCT